MNYKYILFDLDGTLTDSAPGITRSVSYALKKYGIDEKPENLTEFVGPPLYESFIKYYGFSKEKSVEAVAYFREYFTKQGMFENTPYSHIAEVLSKLKQTGHILCVATSKPTVFAEKILKHFHLDTYFDMILGCELDGTRINKDEVIREILMHLPRQKENVIMVGDRHHDICGAKKNGILSIGVLYGYGTINELTQAGADYIIKEPAELLTIC